MTNRIEPIGPHDSDVKAVWPVLRRAVDRERDSEGKQHKKHSEQQRKSAPETVIDHRGDYDGDGEHVDIRA